MPVRSRMRGFSNVVYVKKVECGFCPKKDTQSLRSTLEFFITVEYTPVRYSIGYYAYPLLYRSLQIKDETVCWMECKGMYVGRV